MGMSVKSDILTEVSVLYHRLCNPIEVHIDAVFHIFNYFNTKRKCIPGKLVFDDLEQPPYMCPIKSASKDKKGCMDFYPDVEEILPNLMTEPLGRKLIIYVYVDEYILETY